jgi:sarcosine oxidase
MKTYDAIVVGLGGVGSAAAFHLASRGVRVLGLERFTAAHDCGSSHGHTRVIRKAYYEHADYVPLLREAYRLWHDLEQRSGKKLFHETGLLQVGPASGEVISGVLKSAETHRLAVEKLAADEVIRRFPGFKVPEQSVGVFESAAGYLRVEDCVRTHLEQAEAAGAELRFDTPVNHWRKEQNAVAVTCRDETFSTGALVIATGAWSVPLLANEGVQLNVLRKHLHWFVNNAAAYQQQHGCPVFLYELPEGIYYGFPQIDDCGVKLAEHSGGEMVAEPSRLSREIDCDERARVSDFRGAYLPGVSSQSSHHAVCMYTMTADGHFIVDRLPEHPRVTLAAGLSGHGFKFTCGLGKALADIALDGRSDLPVDFLRLGRFA